MAHTECGVGRQPRGHVLCVVGAARVQLPEQFDVRLSDVLHLGDIVDRLQHSVDQAYRRLAITERHPLPRDPFPRVLVLLAREDDGVEVRLKV